MKLQVGYLRLELQGHIVFLSDNSVLLNVEIFSTSMLQVVYSCINFVVHFFTYNMLSYPQVLSSTPCTVSSWDLLVDGLTLHTFSRSALLWNACPGLIYLDLEYC